MIIDRRLDIDTLVMVTGRDGPILGEIASPPILRSGIPGYRVRPLAGGYPDWHPAALIQEHPAEPATDRARLLLRYWRVSQQLRFGEPATLEEAAGRMIDLSWDAEMVSFARLSGAVHKQLCQLGLGTADTTTQPPGAA
jgi:hypothetical protein